MSSLRPIFPTVRPFFRPQLGFGESFRFWRDKWTGDGRLGQSFPRLFALAPDPECSVQHAWHRVWAPPLPAALSEQRTTDFLRMQEYLLPWRPAAGGDRWIWGVPKFSSRAVYRRLQDRAGLEDQLFLRLWRWVWRSRIPLKIYVFLWLLLRRRLMTRALHQGWISTSSAECVMCGASLEDCNHIFVTCPIARAVWASTKVCRPLLSSLDAFWRSVADGPYRRAAEWQLTFATLWMLWIHRNEVIFRGRNPSANAVLHDVGGLVFTWNRAGLGPLTVVPL